jgi:ribose-phosphate pyrophosphokinase
MKFTQWANGETKNFGKQLNMGGLMLDCTTKGFVTVNFKYENDSDFIKLLFLKRHLDEFVIPSILVIYYMPYSRMDRVEGNAVFTLKYVADLINFMNFKRVVLVEPHSDVAPALINRCVVLSPTFKLLEEVEKEVGFNRETDYIFFPDAGSQKRYGKIEGYKQLVAFKQRNFETGRIKSFKVVGDAPKGNSKVIIVDDLSSYGGTFDLSAEKLRELGFSEIYLLVTHAENAILDGEIPKKNLINRVFTTNSILELSEHHDQFKVYDIEEIVDGLLSE